MPTSFHVLPHVNVNVPMLTSRVEYQKVRPQCTVKLSRQDFAAETGLSTWGLDCACGGFLKLGLAQGP